MLRYTEMTTVLIPQDIISSRTPLLQRTLSRLPTAILFALRAGLCDYQDKLEPGRLYTDDGGCAVGVMLRTIFPGAFCQPGVVFWLRRHLRPSVKDDFTALAREEVRLHHIEIIFDRSVAEIEAANPDLDSAAAASWVGRWMVAAIEEELATRRRIAPPLPKTLDRRPPEARLAGALARSGRE